MTSEQSVGYMVPVERVEGAILVIRGERVMLDRDLAGIYGVTTKALNQAVRRNRDRFPEGFVFQLTSEERDELVTNCDRFARLKHSTSMPYAFTEHGAVKLAALLKSKRAVEVSNLKCQIGISSSPGGERDEKKTLRTAMLNNQLAESARLEKEIQKNLKGLGYGG